MSNTNDGPGLPRAITGFQQDEHGDWVAGLSCGHNQHVRHRPPWELRPWVLTEAGRREHIGSPLLCKQCLRPTAQFHEEA